MKHAYPHELSNRELVTLAALNPAAAERLADLEAILATRSKAHDAAIQAADEAPDNSVEQIQAIKRSTDTSTAVNNAAADYRAHEMACIKLLQAEHGIDAAWAKARQPEAYNAFLDALDRVLEARGTVGAAGTLDDVARTTDTVLTAERVLAEIKKRLNKAVQGPSEQDTTLVATADPRKRSAVSSLAKAEKAAQIAAKTLSDAEEQIRNARDTFQAAITDAAEAVRGFKVKQGSREVPLIIATQNQRTEWSRIEKNIRGMATKQRGYNDWTTESFNQWLAGLMAATSSSLKLDVEPEDPAPAENEAA